MATPTKRGKNPTPRPEPKGKPRRDDDLMAVDLGPPRPRPAMDLPRDERQLLAQLDYEDQFVRLLLSRYRLGDVVQLVSGNDRSETGRYSLDRFCAFYQQFPVFLGVCRLPQTTTKKMTFARLFYDPIPELVLTSMADLLSVRDSYGDDRPVGVLVPLGGHDTYRCPVSRKTVSAGRCGGLVFRAQLDADSIQMSDDEVQPPVLSVCVDGSDARILVQSVPSWLYQIDRASRQIFGK